MRIKSWIAGMGIVGLVFAAQAMAHETPERERSKQSETEAPCKHAHGHLEYPVGIHVHTQGHRVYHARGRYVSPYDRAEDYARPYAGWGYGPHVIVETDR